MHAIKLNRMKKSVLDLLLIISGLIILFASFTSTVLAESDCTDVEIIDVKVDFPKEYEIEIHQEWEVSGSGDVVLTTIIEYKNIENITVGTTRIRSKDRNIVIYDYERYINESLDESEWFIEFEGPDCNGEFTATLPHNVTPDSRVVERYKIGNYSKPAPVKEWWLGERTGIEFWFPFDRYVTTVGIIPNKEYRLKYSSKIILPHSFLPENQMVRLPVRTNEIEIQNRSAYLWFIHEYNVKIHPVLDGNNWIALVEPIFIQNESVFKQNPYNLAEGQITVFYSRPNLIKQLFYIFTIAMIFFSILPFLKNKNEKPWTKIYGAFKPCGAIWIAQEGLISLLPSARPSTFTLYDSTIFIPIVVLGICLFYQGWLWWRSRDDITVPY
jgi:hypothetical protein